MLILGLMMFFFIIVVYFFVYSLLDKLVIKKYSSKVSSETKQELSLATSRKMLTSQEHVSYSL